jgi:serine/threonine protein kinase
MAPEQRHRLGVSREADQFAMAVMAYEILTGKLPSQVFRLASARNSRLNESVDVVLERALQEQPEARFFTVAAFAAALDAALDETCSQSVPPTSAWLNPKVLLSSIVAVALCAMLLHRVTSSDTEPVTLPGRSVADAISDLNEKDSTTEDSSANREPIQ